VSTYTQIYYHLVFSTKYRVPSLAKEKRPALFGYMAGIIQKKRSKPYLINGMDDHVHIFSSLHPTQNLANFIRDIKLASSEWLKESKEFSAFTHWQDGYGAFTHSHQEKKALITYVENQEIHHRKKTFQEEFKQLLLEAGVEFDEKYLE